MRSALRGIRRFYGAHPLHLLGLLACFALAGYVVDVLGPSALWNVDVWWQSILVWFIASIIAHDLVLFPIFAVADRALRRLPRPRTAVNYLRAPALAAGLLLLLFLPGIVEQGQATYLAATGQTQDPYLARWLLITAALFVASASAYAIRLSRNRTTQPQLAAPAVPARPHTVTKPRGSRDLALAATFLLLCTAHALLRHRKH